MKQTIKIIICSCALFALFLIMPYSNAQEPPHPPTTGHGVNGNQSPGGTAPIDGGLGILIALGVAFGTRKLIKEKKSIQE
jgi:hypothetical protein